MNTDELCNTIEGLPDDAPTLGSLVIFDIADLKALVRERNNLLTALCPRCNTFVREYADVMMPVREECVRCGWHGQSQGPHSEQCTGAS